MSPTLINQIQTGVWSIKSLEASLAGDASRYIKQQTERMRAGYFSEQEPF